MGRDEFRDYPPESSREKGRFQAPADFDGPIANRSCTDVIFALLMLLSWAAMTGVGEFTIGQIVAIFIAASSFLSSCF